STEKTGLTNYAAVTCVVSIKKHPPRKPCAFFCNYSANRIAGSGGAAGFKSIPQSCNCAAWVEQSPGGLGIPIDTLLRVAYIPDRWGSSHFPREKVMEVDQKHITTIRLHDAKGSDIRLVKEFDNYQLHLVSSNHVVFISLGLDDVRKLWQQIVQLDLEETSKMQAATTADSKSIIFSGGPKSFHETMAHLFSKMAREMCETAAKR